MNSAIRIGILNDLSDGPPNLTDIEQWLRWVANDFREAGRLQGDIEFIHAWGLGLPNGTAEAIERAYRELVAQDVVLIVGPAIGDNALIATPLAEQFRVPTINWAGSEKARSEYMFQLQVGSHEDESIVLARHLATMGAHKLGVVYDNSPIGHGHLTFLRDEAVRLQQQIVASAEISPLADDVDIAVSEILNAGVDALVYLGLGVSAPAVARVVKQRAQNNHQPWRGICAMNTAGIRGYQRAFAEMIDGWFYVDLFSDHNRTLQAFYERTHAIAKNRLAAAKGFDIGRLVAESLLRAPVISREGIKIGLERIKWLPAAQGYEGTLLGFGNYDRGALHGRYLVLRQWRNGQSIEVAASV